MTGHDGDAMAGGSPLSDTDRARSDVDQRLHHEQQLRTVAVVAAASLDVTDCVQLLSMLGIATDVVRAARAARTRGTDQQSTPRAAA